MIIPNSGGHWDPHQNYDQHKSVDDDVQESVRYDHDDDDVLSDDDKCDEAQVRVS